MTDQQSKRCDLDFMQDHKLVSMLIDMKDMIEKEKLSYKQIAEICSKKLSIIGLNNQHIASRLNRLDIKSYRATVYGEVKKAREQRREERLKLRQEKKIAHLMQKRIEESQQVGDNSQYDIERLLTRTEQLDRRITALEERLDNQATIIKVVMGKIEMLIEDLGGL